MERRSGLPFVDRGNETWSKDAKEAFRLVYGTVFLLWGITFVIGEYVLKGG